MAMAGRPVAGPLQHLPLSEEAHLLQANDEVRIPGGQSLLVEGGGAPQKRLGGVAHVQHQRGDVAIVVRDIDLVHALVLDEDGLGRGHLAVEVG